MNSCSLTSDSRRWWWLPATAGALVTTAVSAVLVVPATGTVTPIAPSSSDGVGGDGGTVTVVERPCYLARPGWNTVRGWEQPVCTTQIGPRVDGAVPHGRRPAPDYLP